MFFSFSLCVYLCMSPLCLFSCIFACLHFTSVKCPIFRARFNCLAQATELIVCMPCGQSIISGTCHYRIHNEFQAIRSPPFCTLKLPGVSFWCHRPCQNNRFWCNDSWSFVTYGDTECTPECIQCQKTSSLAAFEGKSRRLPKRWWRKAEQKPHNSSSEARALPKEKQHPRKSTATSCQWPAVKTDSQILMTSRYCANETFQSVRYAWCE